VHVLGAGIDVLSTVDVQDLESLPGVVEQLTGTPRTETVPDAVARRADRIELVDTTPDALLRPRAGHPLDPVLEARERVVVALTGGPRGRRSSAARPGWPDGREATCSPSTSSPPTD
jgi:osmosensitive K+ channel His kinase sensor protein